VVSFRFSCLRARRGVCLEIDIGASAERPGNAHGGNLEKSTSIPLCLFDSVAFPARVCSSCCDLRIAASVVAQPADAACG